MSALSSPYPNQFAERDRDSRDDGAAGSCPNPCTGRQHMALAGASPLNCLALVKMQLQGLAQWLVGRLSDPEDLARFALVQQALTHKLVNQPARRERRVDAADARVRPKLAFSRKGWTRPAPRSARRGSSRNSRRSPRSHQSGRRAAPEHPCSSSSIHTSVSHTDPARVRLWYHASTSSFRLLNSVRNDLARFAITDHKEPVSSAVARATRKLADLQRPLIGVLCLRLAR